MEYKKKFTEMFSTLFEAKTKYQFYIDMDGTLCDFEKKAKEIFNTDDLKKIDEKALWKKLAPPNTKNFFGSLDWMPGAQKIWAVIAPYKPTILTATQNAWAIPQKRQWVAQHLGKNIPVKITRSHEKHLHAKKNAVLIDDRSDIIYRWRKQGGIGIRYSTAEKVLAQLKTLLG